MAEMVRKRLSRALARVGPTPSMESSVEEIDIFLSQLAVIADGKAVHLVLNGGNERKRASVGIDGNFAAVFRDGARPVPVVLYHAEQRNGKPRRVQDGLNGRHMSPAAVQQNQVRQTAEAFAAASVLPVLVKPPRNHLAHGGVVVLPDDSFES